VNGLEILEIEDARWVELEQQFALDPQCTHAYLSATSSVDRRPVLLRGEGPGWNGIYQLVLEELGHGSVLARTPDYGGPWIEADDPATAAAEFRALADEASRSLGAVSEVMLLSPWIPGRDTIAETWGCSADKEIALLPLGDDETRLRRASGNRRREIVGGGDGLTTSWTRFTSDDGVPFSHRYAQHMVRRSAEPRWRLTSEYFSRLANAPGVRLDLASASSSAGAGAGGADALFLTHNSRSVHLFGTRWGSARGSAAAAQWRAHHELDACGVRELLLGGGVTSAADDPLLAFKRRWGGNRLELLLGARVFDADAHAAAVASGRARRLPSTTVSA
jgi:hypothetical protein